MHSSAHAPFDIRWRGHWLWLPEANSGPHGMMGGAPRGAPESHAFFRRSFTLDNVPASAPARITADSRYVLYVNGREASRGPVRSQPRRLRYDVVDLAPLLQPGENVVAVYVKYFGDALSAWMPAVANNGLGRGGVFVFEAILGDDWLVSDASWRGTAVDAYSQLIEAETNAIAGGVPTEIVDARLLPKSWSAHDFDDAAWPTAHIVMPIHIGGPGRSQPPSDPYGPLLRSSLPPRGGDVLAPHSVTIASPRPWPQPKSNNPAARVVDSVLDSPAEAVQATLPLTVDGPARIVVDMGRIVAGLVQFEVDAPAGTVLDFGYLEEPLRERSIFLGHGGNRYIARGADDSHEVFDPKGFRYAVILVQNPDARVTLRRFALREMVYPWQPGGSFECSDELLNRIYAAGVRTVQLNSWDALIDCPTREQRAWVGDAVVHQMVHLATNGDWRMARHYLELGNSPRSDGILPMSVAGDVEHRGDAIIPDWSLHWVHGVHNLYRWSGDRAKVKEFMPTIERILRWYVPYLTDGGAMQDVVEWSLVDWSSVFTSDVSSILTALWARGLREFAEMAAWLGENASREWAETMHTCAKAGFEMFWDEARGTYRDQIRIDGAPNPACSQIAGAAAIVGELAPRERWARIIETITDERVLVERSWAHTKRGASGGGIEQRMGALFMGVRHADWDAAREIVRAEPFMSYVVHDAVVAAGMADRLPQLCRRWGEFLVDGYDTLGENWGFGTRVHGWSSTPTRDLVCHTLGITPAAPGFAAVRIAPRPGGLSWMRGSAPTPHGPIHVEWRDGALTVDSPVPYEVDLG